KVYTDDPDTPVCHVRIAANVVKRKETTGNVSVKPRKLSWKITEGIIAVAADTLKIANHSADSLTVAVLHVPETIVERIEAPQCITAGEEANLFLYVLRETVSGETDGLSITLAFTARDTTIVTIPIEIED
ncbi:MAG: hypothetical protein KAT58_00835, partial [candidate division Zixibacteria bacterium]|nr:hypothetical protein [candidate division Zixibacteria bacterium]